MARVGSIGSMATKSVLLKSGQRMPLLGLGTWQVRHEEIEQAVDAALEAGYRHIDTAFNYNNEEAIGRALRRWIDGGRCGREDLFITTKLPHVGNRASDVEKYLKKSLSRLRLDYVDLYLIHMPFGFVPDSSGENPAKHDDGSYVLDDTDHVAVWKEMEKQVDEGLTRNIGVSNYNIEQLERTVANARILPATNQVELHAYLQQTKLRASCAKLGIPITAYSPLGSPGARIHFEQKYNYQYPDNTAPDLLQHPLVKDIANAHQKTTAQVLLKHLIQQGIIVIPKSTNPKRIKENAEIFDFQLTPDQMMQLSGLDLGEEGRIINFRFWKGVEKHPEYPFTIQKSA
ncbi:hypothetical protein L9F63_017063 [Diploptera punctata]|uniref:NADP-dependent oxidoreductase domain-containing protein n=1 Tax=Diploptera punctata TaxID=6984 RepID=A0AAD8EH38_DIPPU|nr:hypothetical protein L9F63_017063 [Diploptera punctata]